MKLWLTPFVARLFCFIIWFCGKFCKDVVSYLVCFVWPLPACPTKLRIHVLVVAWGSPLIACRIPLVCLVAVEWTCLFLVLLVLNPANPTNVRYICCSMWLRYHTVNQMWLFWHNCLTAKVFPTNLTNDHCLRVPAVNFCTIPCCHAWSFCSLWFLVGCFRSFCWKNCLVDPPPTHTGVSCEDLELSASLHRGS